jgi:hypothetical protein
MKLTTLFPSSRADLKSPSVTFPSTGRSSFREPLKRKTSVPTAATNADTVSTLRSNDRFNRKSSNMVKGEAGRAQKHRIAGRNHQLNFDRRSLWSSQRGISWKLLSYYSNSPYCSRENRADLAAPVGVADRAGSDSEHVPTD